MSDAGYPTAQTLVSGTTEYNSMAFFVRQILGQICTAELVRVEAINTDGTIDVLPLLYQMDGAGQAVAHDVIHSVPYFVLQAGASAVELTPAVGDIGLAIMASRDISAAKNAKGQALPGSKRRFDWADALYIGGFLNGMPTQYVRMDANGIEIVSPIAVSITAPQTTVHGPLTVTGPVLAEQTVTVEGAFFAQGAATITGALVASSTAAIGTGALKAVKLSDGSNALNLSAT